MSSLNILTGKQREELHKAIFQYVSNQCISVEEDEDIIDRLRLLLNVPPNINDNVISNYLEKKWTSVLRLQNKLVDLEKENTELKELINSNSYVGKRPFALKDKLEWLPEQPHTSFTLQYHQMAQSVSIHPYLSITIAGCSDGSLILWNLANFEISLPEKIIKAHTRGINHITWSKKPVDLSSASEVSIRSTPTYLMATCSLDTSIKIWDAETFDNVRTLTGHDHTVSSAVFSRLKPSLLYTVSRDRTTKAWDLCTGLCLRTFVGHSDWVRDIDTVPLNSTEEMVSLYEDNDFVLTCSNDQSVRLSHARSGNGICLLLGHTHVVERAKFLPLQSNLIIDGFLERNSALFPFLAGGMLHDSMYANVLGYKYCVTCARDNTIKLWMLPPASISTEGMPQTTDFNEGEGWLITELIGHKSWVRSLSIHPNGRYIISGGDDRDIFIWDLETLNSRGRVEVIKILSSHVGFINDTEFAQVTEDHSSHEEGTGLNDEAKKRISEKVVEHMRCIFLSCATDNTVKVWC